MNRVSIDSDNGLSPDRRQAIIWISAGILTIGPLGTNFSEILSKIQNCSFMKMHFKMLSGKWRPFCPGGDELRRIIGEGVCLTCGIIGVWMIDKIKLFTTIYIWDYLLCSFCNISQLCIEHHHEFWPTSVGHPFSFLNSSRGLTGGKQYQKITIAIFTFVLQNFIFQAFFLYILSYHYLFSLRLKFDLLLQYVALFQSELTIYNRCKLM